MIISRQKKIILHIQIGIITLVSMAFTACFSNKKAAQSSQPIFATQMELPSNISFSNQFRILWDELSSITNNFNKIESFVPSADFISKYNLRKNGDSYNLTGFIEVNNAFNKEAFEKLSGSISTYNNELASFSIPVKELKAMVQLPGIKRIEINQKIRIKK